MSGQFTVIGIGPKGTQSVRAHLDDRKEVERAIKRFDDDRKIHTVLVIDTSGPDPKMEEHVLTMPA